MNSYKHLKQILLIFALALFCNHGYAQSERLSIAQSDSAKITEYREKIGLDVSIPDFKTKKVDEKVMDVRLAGLINYLLESIEQNNYTASLSLIIGEQNNLP